MKQLNKPRQHRHVQYLSINGSGKGIGYAKKNWFAVVRGRGGYMQIKCDFLR